MATENRPWLDRDDYPFESNYFELPMGEMHFIDEGDIKSAVMQGSAELLTYGTAVKLIKRQA